MPDKDDNIEENNDEGKDVSPKPVPQYSTTKSAIEDLPSTAVQSIHIENDTPVEVDDSVFVWKENITPSGTKLVTKTRVTKEDLKGKDKQVPKQQPPQQKLPKQKPAAEVKKTPKPVGGGSKEKVSGQAKPSGLACGSKEKVSGQAKPSGLASASKEKVTNKAGPSKSKEKVAGKVSSKTSGSSESVGGGGKRAPNKAGGSKTSGSSESVGGGGKRAPPRGGSKSQTKVSAVTSRPKTTASKTKEVKTGRSKEGNKPGESKKK